MLHKETVDESTLELLNQIQQKEYLKGFYLVGGTALALRMACFIENSKIKMGNC